MSKQALKARINRIPAYHQRESQTVSLATGRQVHTQWGVGFSCGTRSFLVHLQDIAGGGLPWRSRG